MGLDPIYQDKEFHVKSKFVLSNVLLALFLAICEAQDAANDTGEVTGVPVVSTDESMATKTSIPPTGAMEEALPTLEAGMPRLPQPSQPMTLQLEWLERRQSPRLGRVKLMPPRTWMS